MPLPSKPDIGRYHVLTELGQGGTANVFLAVASGLEGFSKLAVLKRMKPLLASEPGFATMFLDEARLAARLGHSNIVQTYEVFKDGELPVIVMEYLEGQTLANIVAKAVERPGFALEHHLAIISEALSGLEYSHELRDFDGQPLEVVHRDVTPHNLFVTFDGQVKVLDFGIAKLSGSMVETESGVIKGKLRYIPPEQMVSEAVDRRADIYSVGVMLWEAATGEKMWRGVGDATIMNRVINGDIPRPSDIRPSVARELERIVLEALSPNREDRHPTAKALQEDLDGFRSTLPLVSARELGPLMERLFESERADQRRTIELHLRDARLHSTPPAKAADEPTSPNFAVSDASTTLVVTKTNPVLVSAAIAVLAVLAFVFWPENPPSVEVGEVPAAAATAAAERTIEVRVVASPAEAVISIDGVRTQQNPAVTLVPEDGSVHVVRAEAAGYEEAQETVRFDRSRSIVLRLSRRAAPVVAASAAPTEAPRALPRPAKGVRPNCEPPFVIDPRGIKRFKPECVE